MTERDLYWLAGLLEGEGCFRTLEVKRRTIYRYPTIQLKMTDEDIVRRAAGFMGNPPVYKVCETAGMTKPTYLLRVRGEIAASLMCELRPILGQRRQAKIDEVLAVPMGRQDGMTRAEVLLNNPNILTTQRARQTHCIHGHLFDEENTRRNRRGNRQCRACERDRKRQRAARAAGKKG